MLRQRESFVWIRGMIAMGTLVVLVSGCVHWQEAGRRLWGTSVSHLEKARDGGHALDVTLGLDAAFAKVDEILVESDAQVYLRDKDKAYLAAMGFPGNVDTTQAGVFFEARTKNVTRIEVASMSPSLAEKVFRLLSEELGASPSLYTEGEDT